MRMKKRMLLLAAALLACFPVWASAQIEIIGKDNSSLGKHKDGSLAIQITSDMNGATISGNGQDVWLEVDQDVTELTLKDLTITGPSHAYDDGSGAAALRYAYGTDNEKTLTLTIVGSNNLTGGGSTNNSGGCGIWVYKGSLKIEGKPGSSLTATGGDSTKGFGGEGIGASAGLTIDTKGTVTANGGAGKSGGAGLAATIKIDLTGAVTANGGAGKIRAGAGMETRSLTIHSGSNVAVHGGEGPRSGGFLGKDVTVEGGTLKAAGKGETGFGIFCVDNGALAVSGDGVVTAQGGIGAALTSGMNDEGDMVYLPASVKADGLVIRAGESEALASVVEDHTKLTLTNYLRIGEAIVPGGAAAIGGADLPQTGDHARLGLWCLLACLSMLGAAAVRAKKEA